MHMQRDDGIDTIAAPSQRLEVADSFRTRVNPKTGSTEVRGIELHKLRFMSASNGAGAGSQGDLDTFIDQTIEQIAAYGDGFPRWELWRAGSDNYTPKLSLRPLPALSESLAMRTLRLPPLPHANRKGPNIKSYAEYNRTLGAEALLVDADGVAREGATTSLIWWHGDQARSVSSAHRVSSVTEALLAQSLGSLREASATPAELSECEVWAVNALHGIRVVTNIDGIITRSPNAARLALVRAQLEQAWQPLPLRTQ